MKRHCRMPLFVLLALCPVLFYCGFTSQQVLAAQDEATEEEDVGYTEEEYAAWEAADKEADALKSGTMLIDFIKKSPDSKLAPYAESSYKRLMVKCVTEKKYQEAETLAEKWETVKPGDKDAIGVIVTAAGELKHTEKYIQNLEKLYALEAKLDYARVLADAYKKSGNDEKYIQWSETLLKAPEENNNFLLRYELMRYYAAKENTGKMIEYAQATLKAIDQVKDPTPDIAKIIPDIRHECYDMIGRARFANKKYNDAINAFQNALKIKKYADGYYFIASCLDQQNKPDNAILAYAKAQLQGEAGDAAAKITAAKAKERLEIIYKAMHNGNTVGIDKQYRKAKETADENLAAAM